MKILMIHGIGQEGSTKDELLKIWTDSLKEIGDRLKLCESITMAYYGTTLADFANGESGNAVGMGVESVAVNVADDNELQFISSVMEQMAKNEDISDAAIDAAANEVMPNPVAMDNFLYRRLNGLLRVIEKISPMKGSLLFRVVKQAYTYLSSPAAQDAVDKIVRPLLENGPQILITHSLGTVIAFKLLRELENDGKSLEIPLLITMGSPLAVEAIKQKLGAPTIKPNIVKRWVNFYDPSDFVTLGKPLDEDNFSEGIQNDDTVNNTTRNAHGVVEYLPHVGVIKELKEILSTLPQKIPN